MKNLDQTSESSWFENIWLSAMEIMYLYPPAADWLVSQTDDDDDEGLRIKMF